MKLRSNAKYEIERVKKNRRNYGDILTMRNDGSKIYLASRMFKEIYRGGKKTISEALRDGTAGWAIDNDTLWEMKRREIPVVGVYVRDTGDIYLAPIDLFFDTTKATVKSYSNRGGSLQRILPLSLFKKKDGQIRKL